MKINDILNSSWNNIRKISNIIRASVISFQREGGARGAAGMAYYTLFSLFPLLIVLVTIGSYFVDAGEATSRVGRDTRWARTRGKEY